MIGNIVTLAVGDLGLLGFDDFIDKFLDLAAADTDDMVVMAFPVELEYRLTTLEMMARYQAGGLELGQNAVHRGKTDFFSLVTQCLYISSALWCLTVDDSIKSRIFIRGNVTLRPAFFRSLVSIFHCWAN